MRLRLIGLALIAALTPIAAGAARPPAAPAAADPFSRHSQAVTDHVHLIYKSRASLDAPFEGNVTVIEQAAGLVVVDAGGSPLSGRHIVARIRAISRKPVRYLIYTHYHGDHNLGAGALLDAWPGLTIISTAATRENMLGQPMAYIKTYDAGNRDTADYARQQLKDAKLSPSMRQGWSRLIAAAPAMEAAYRGLKAYPASLTFTDRLTLADPIAPVEVAFLGRANTDGDAVVWTPKQRVLITGDIVVHPVPYASASYPADWIAVLGKIDAFDYAWLVPGHGEVQTDHAYVRKLAAALAEVRSQVGPLAAKGVPLAEVYKQTDFKDLKDSFAGADDFDRFLTSAFFLGAIVSNAYKEARGEPIVQGHDGG